VYREILWEIQGRRSPGYENFGSSLAPSMSACGYVNGTYCWMMVRRIGVRFSLYAALLVRIAELQLAVSVHAGYCTSVGDVRILYFQCRNWQSCVFITLVLRWPGYDILNDTLTCMPSANGCRTQVPWMGDVVVTYGSSAGLGRQ